MKHMSLRWAWRSVVMTAFVAGVAIAPMPMRAASQAKAPVYLISYSQTHTTFVRNFNPFQPAAYLDFTQGAIYEPLAIVTTAGTGHTYPWLATSWAWSNGNKTLTFTIRPNVKWSDGLPLTAADVAFSYNYGKTHPAADLTGLWGTKQLTSVRVVGTNQVALTFSAVNTTVLATAASNIAIIPQHIWSNIADPATYDNQDPIGSGPFTQVISFSPQEFILGKNPYYWQPLSYDGIKVPAISSNDQALAAMVSHQLDWTADYIPGIQKSYVAKDPTHFHYFTAYNNPTIGLFFNDSVYPYSLVAFRQAVSEGIDRTKVAGIGEAGNVPPADALGVSLAWPSWADPSLNAQVQTLSTFNLATARATLKSAGFTWDGSNNLIDPKGNKVSFVLETPAGWSDWILSYQIMAQTLNQLGMNVTVKQVDQNGFFADRSAGTIPGAWLFTEQSGTTPYQMFEYSISAESYFPTGQDAIAKGSWNQERFSGPDATAASGLLAQFRSTADQATQVKLAYQLEKIWINDLPVVNLFGQPWWYTYSTDHFTGFPNASNNYAIGSTYHYPDNVKVLTTIKPV